jgi:CBS domain-containing protein
MHCRDIMSLRVYFCYEDEPVSRCAEIMEMEGVGFIPILDSQQRLKGVLTDRDLVTRVLAVGKPYDTPAKEVASTEVIACGLNDDLKSVEKLMRDKKKSRIPIINEKHECMGVISLSDIARVETDRQAGKVLRDVATRESHLGAVTAI